MSDEPTALDRDIRRVEMIHAALESVDSATTAWERAQEEANKAALIRAEKVALLVEAIGGGRGAPAEAARLLKVSPPVVAALVRKARESVR